METQKIDKDFTVTGQLEPRDVELVHAMGFRSILCLRPDDEEEGQALFEEIAESARLAGIRAAHLPVVSGGPTEDEAKRFVPLMEELPKPVLAYCKSGGRAARIREMTT